MIEDKLGLQFAAHHKHLEVTFINSMNKVGFRALVDTDNKKKIQSMDWYPGKGHPIGQSGPGEPCIALHRLIANVSSETDCVRHLNGDRRDCREANLEVVPKSYLARTARARSKRKGKRRTDLPCIHQDELGRFYSSHSYRFETIDSPRVDDIDTALQVRDLIAWLLEPKMQHRNLRPNIAADLEETVTNSVLSRKAAIDAKEHPTVTPIQNIYLTSPWPNESYEYAFWHEKIRYRKAGFKSILEALKAYNRSVVKITGDESRRHELPDHLRQTEMIRLARLEELGVLKNGKPKGNLSRKKADEVMQALREHRPRIT